MPSPTDIRPPFTFDTASAKVRAAEDAWNSRDPHRVSLGLMRRREASINDVRIAED
jgi:nuclear transport factor 2 (NTF2) superfamily protein